MTNLAFACLVLAGAGLGQSKYLQAGPIQVGDINGPMKVRAGESIEYRLNVLGSYDNPFDPKQIDVEAVIESEGQTVLRRPAFFAEDFARKLENGKEVLEPIGNRGWRVRVNFPTAKTYRMTIVAKDRSGTATSTPFTVEVSERLAGNNGFIRVAPDQKFFQYENGKPYFPIGSNVCWGGDAGVFNFESWLPKYAQQGCNFFRVWLSPSWTTFGMEPKGSKAEGKGPGFLSLEAASKLDRVMELAQTHQLRVKLCFESYNVLRDKDAYPAWDDSVYNRANGGPLVAPHQFWRDPDAQRMYRNKMRYLVARYGADPNVFAWEFWNEADLTRDFPAEEAREWHREMGAYLRSIDPYKHLITTSFSNPMGMRTIDTIPELDFIQTHAYGGPDVISQVAIQQSRKGGWNKPHYVGEIGADASGPRATDDPEGLQIHDPLWISTCMGSSGAAMPWWWDSHIEPFNLYSLFGAVARYVKDIDFPNEGFRQTTPKFAWQSPAQSVALRDLNVPSAPGVWEDSPLHKPKTVVIDKDGKVVSGTPIASFFHGRRNHPNWANPVTLQLDLPRRTRFEVVVGDVSGYGGARLEIQLDNQVVMTRDFSDPDDNTKTDTLTTFRGTYGFEIPAGKHTLVVRNTGNDWFEATLRFKGLQKSLTPPLVGWGAVGDSVVMAWTRLADRTWKRVCENKESIAVCPPTILSMSGLAAGTYRTEIWDTWKGVAIQTQDINVGLDGVLRVRLPEMEKDYAIKAVLAR